VVLSDPLASEPGTDTGTATVVRTGNQAAPITVRYTLGGTAFNGVDYQTLSGSVTIPAGASSANIVVRPIDDSLVEVGELVTITLSPDSAYTVGSPGSAIITILDNDLPLLGNGLLQDAQ
jgi:FlaG/FlaF family flagellin (archaellin)